MSPPRQRVRLPSTHMDTGPSVSLRTAALKLQIDAVAGEVVAHFDSLGIRCLLIKGPVTARWLYEGQTIRPYGDCDLLVDPAGFGGACTALASLGFQKSMEEVRPEGVPANALSWFRHGVVVDLHRYLDGVGADPQTAFDELYEKSIEMGLRGCRVRTLGLPARCLHLALHAAQHGREAKKPLDDLERGLALLPKNLWSEAAAQAHRIEAVEAFVGGLSLAATGPQLIEELALPRRLTREVALRISEPDTISMGLEWLAQAGGWRRRGAYLRQKIFPSVQSVKIQSGEESASGWRLALLYVFRWSSLARRTPRGLARWARAWLVTVRFGRQR